MDKVTLTFNEIIEKDPRLSFMDRWGKSRTKTKTRMHVLYTNDGLSQFLYGDVLDYIRDIYSDLSLEERDMLAHLLIGHYVITNTLL